MAKMGRPALKPQDRRSCIVRVRLKPAEYKRLQKAAAAAGKPVSEYAAGRLAEAEGWDD